MTALVRSGCRNDPAIRGSHSAGGGATEPWGTNMSNHSDLKVARDIARATAARFVREAADHLMRASDPDFKENELSLATEAKNQAKKWAAKADQLSDMLKKRAAPKSDPTSE